jgi:hypothetical protein
MKTDTNSDDETIREGEPLSDFVARSIVPLFSQQPNETVVTEKEMTSENVTTSHQREVIFVKEEIPNKNTEIVYDRQIDEKRLHHARNRARKDTPVKDFVQHFTFK